MPYRCGYTCSKPLENPTKYSNLQVKKFDLPELSLQFHKAKAFGLKILKCALVDEVFRYNEFLVQFTACAPDARSRVHRVAAHGDVFFDHADLANRNLSNMN